MARRMPPRRNKSRDGARRGKKKVSPLTIAKAKSPPIQREEEPEEKALMESRN